MKTEAVTEQELPKYQVERNPTHEIDSTQKELNKKLFDKPDTLVDKNLSCPRIKFSNSWTLNLDCVEIRVLLSDFAQELRRKNADVPDIHITLLDAAGISPTLVLNQNAKEKGTWVEGVRSGKGCTHRVMLLMGLSAIQ